VNLTVNRRSMLGAYELINNIYTNGNKLQ